MTALTKFIIGSVISFFGSLTLTELAGNLHHGITGSLQEEKSEEVFIFPASKAKENYYNFTCLRYNFKERSLDTPF